MGSPVGRPLLEWKCLLLDQRFAHSEKIRRVDSQHLNRGAANLCSACQHRSDPLEVDAPLVRARMEESNELPSPRIRSRDVRAFVPVAVEAGEGEILEDGLASMLACNYVIDVKGQTIDVSGKVTILASVLGTLPNFPNSIPVHERRGFVLRARRALDCMTANRFPTCR